MVNLTNIQKEIVKLAKEKGRITILDLTGFYSTTMYRSNAVRRLIVLGFLKISDTRGDAYEWTGKEVEIQ